MRILIVRHGDPDYANDCLTEKGRVEAALLADKLEKEKLDYFYSSPMGRARETCETVRVRTGKRWKYCLGFGNLTTQSICRRERKGI